MVTRFEAEGDREGRRVRHRARPDRLRHGVDARVGGRARWKAVGQDGIDERVLRAHVRVPEADLAIALGVGEHARARHLAPRPRRRRAEHEADSRRLRRPRPARVLRDRAALVGCDARGLGDVERGSAADADDGVEAAVTDVRGELVGEGQRRLARPLDDALEADARALRGRERGEHAGVRRDGLLDDDERARRAERLEDAGQLGDDYVAECDLDRELGVERRDGVRHAVAARSGLRSAR